MAEKTTAPIGDYPLQAALAATLEGTALGRLVLACEADFMSPATELEPGRSDDDESVAAGDAGESAITFGMIRDAKREVLDLARLPAMTGVQRVQVEERDLLVFTCPQRIPPPSRDHFEGWIRERVGPSVRVMILEDGLRLDAILTAPPKAEGAAPPPAGGGL